MFKQRLLFLEGHMKKTSWVMLQLIRQKERKCYATHIPIHFFHEISDELTALQPEKIFK